MAKNNRITLYDLQLASGCTISPFVWATKYALAHKGFEVDVVPGGFTGILDRTGGRSERLPVRSATPRWRRSAAAWEWYFSSSTFFRTARSCRT